MQLLALIAGYTIVGFVGLLGLAVVWKVWSGKIDLGFLISEKGSAESPASLSRFQFLIFTFVVAMCLLVLTIDSGEFPKLDPNILGLMGISGGSYLISKSIPRSKGSSAVKTEETHTLKTQGDQ